MRNDEYIERQKVFDSLPVINDDKTVSLYGAIADFIAIVSKIPSAEVVSKTAFEQVVWERDTALRQLREDYGVGLGEKKRDVAEVRHGEWIPVDEKRDAFDCSECDAMVSRMMNYCPNCGARMDKEDEHEAG